MKFPLQPYYSSSRANFVAATCLLYREPSTLLQQISPSPSLTRPQAKDSQTTSCLRLAGWTENDDGGDGDDGEDDDDDDDGDDGDDGEDDGDGNREQCCHTHEDQT